MRNKLILGIAVLLFIFTTQIQTEVRADVTSGEIQYNIELDKIWLVKFNRAIDPESAKNGNIQITLNDNVIETQIEVDGDKAYIKPTSKFKPKTYYTLDISGNIRDLSGKKLKEPVTVYFVTVDENYNQEPPTVGKPPVEPPVEPPIVDKPPVEPPIGGDNLPNYTDTFLNEYGVDWRLTSTSGGIHMYSVYNNKISAEYSTKPGYTRNGIKVGDTSDKMLAVLGEPLKYITKENTNWIIDEYKGRLTFLTVDGYTTYIFDTLDGNKITGIQWVSKELEESRKLFAPVITPELEKSFSRLMIVLTNDSRTEHNLTKLLEHKVLNKVATLHSEDMVINNYFSHYGLNGSTPGDRIGEEMSEHVYWSENIHQGGVNPIQAHSSLMNSKGHRENILEPYYTHFGIGIKSNSNNVPYYTINFVIIPTE